MTFPPANPPMVHSRLAGREVSTWSEEWKHECESVRGIKAHRGDAAVAQLVSEIERYRSTGP